MTDDWPQIKARLESALKYWSSTHDDQIQADIRAALQRVEEQDKLLDAHEKAFERQVERAEAAEAKLARVEEVREELASLAMRDDRDSAARAAWHRAIRLLAAALAAAKGGK